ncbi:MAG: ATP-binding protein [bacterium]
MKNSLDIPWWDKIKNKLLISLILTFTILLTIFSFICLSYFKKCAIQDTGAHNLRVLTDIKEKTESFISSIMNDLFSLASNLEKSENWEYQQGELFSNYLKKMSDVYRLTLFDNSGKELLILSKEVQKPTSDWLSRIGPHGDKTTFQENLSVSPVYLSDQVMSMIDVSIPIRSFQDRRINGAIKAGVSLHGLWEKISVAKRERDTTVYFIDKEGKLIAHSDIGLIPTGIDFGHIQKVRQFIFAAPGHDLDKPSIYYNNKNVKVIGVLVPIEKTNWGVIVERSVESALSSYHRLRKITFFILAGLILLASLITYFFVARFTRSIDSITQQARELNEEEIPRTIEVNSKDEIAYLAEIFNYMKKQISRKDENLKRRYKELEEINGEFQESYDEFEQVSEKLEESQHELDKQKEFEKQLIETANVLIVVLGPKGEIILFNKKCEELTGYGKDEVLGKDWYQLMVPSEEREKYPEYFQPALKGDPPSSSFECPILTKRGALRTISWHRAFISNEEQAVVSINIGEDITEKRDLQQELEQKNRALEEKNEELQHFVSIVSHDLKSPLYVLQDFTSILLHDHKHEFGEDVVYYLERIKKNAENMEKLIIDILEFSKIGAAEDDYQNYPIIQIIQRAIEELNSKIEEGDIHLAVSQNFPTVYCDPNRILQVFINLISNAVKFMSPGRKGIIEIGYTDLGTEYRFFIKDNGIGIEKEYHEKIFQIFQRIKDSKEIEGNGVGLAIVKKIVENHGGKIWVESQKGKGSAFYFTLPTPKKAKPKDNQPLSSILV